MLVAKNYNDLVFIYYNKLNFHHVDKVFLHQGNHPTQVDLSSIYLLLIFTTDAVREKRNLWSPNQPVSKPYDLLPFQICHSNREE